MNYVWVDRLRNNFWHNSQRSRLLMCDALMNSFTTFIFFFAIQFVYNKLTSIFIIFEKSFIIIATFSIYYLERTFVMIKIVKRWFDKVYMFKHVKWRLNITFFLWTKFSKNAKSEPQKHKSKKMKKINNRVKLQSFVVLNMIAFYSEIVRECRSKTFFSTFIVRDLQKIIFYVVFFDRDYSFDTLFKDSKNSNNADNSSNSSSTEKIYEIVNSSICRESRLFN